MPILRILWLCDALEWRHLPVAGAVYDQDPEFLDGMLMLKEVRGRYEEKKRKEDEAKNKSNMGKGRGKR